MKKVGKQFYKATLAAVVSLMLAVVLAFGGTAFSAITASAETTAIQKITLGTTSKVKWSASQEETYFGFEVTETGFYSLTVADHKQTATTLISLYDNTVDNGFEGYISEDIRSTPYTLDRILLTAGHKYIAYCTYYHEVYNDQTHDYDYTYYDGEISVMLNKSSYTPIAVPNSGSTNVNLQFDVAAWLSFETTTAGDYSLNIGDTNVNLYGDLYNASTGEYIGYFDSEYYNCDDESVFADKIVMPLEANTKYYFRIYSFSREDNSYSVKLSFTKNSKNVKNITINSAIVDFRYWFTSEDINEHCFNYKVSYSDGTSSIMRCYEINSTGYKTPEINFPGSSTEVNGESVLIAGYQPVYAYYNGNTETFYINVESLTDYCSDIEPIYPLDICTVEYEGSDEYTYLWRVRVNETAVYDIFTYYDNQFGDNFDYYTISIVDEKNNVVSHDNHLDACPLVAGREYVLVFTYKYAASSTRTVEWRLEKTSETLFPDAQPGSWYHDAVTYSAGRGIIKGYANGNFGTTNGIQRQDFLVMLARLDGVDLEEYAYDSEFPDVGRNSYYEAAVNWGYENGIVTGYESGYFGVGNMINREQIVTFLCRYADYCKGLDTSVSPSSKQAIQAQYADYNNVSDYAKSAMLWAIDRGVIKGKNTTTIAPAGTAQRCEIAQIMYNIFINEIF